MVEPANCKISAVNSLCMLHNIMYSNVRMRVCAFTKFNLQVDMSGLTFCSKCHRITIKWSDPGIIIPFHAEMHLAIVRIHLHFFFFFFHSSFFEFVQQKSCYILYNKLYYNGCKTITLKCGCKLFLFVQF